MYVADSENNVIRKITSAGVVTTFSSQQAFGAALPFNGVTNFVGFYPTGLTVDTAGNVYVTDGSHLWKATSDGAVTYLAGGNPVPGAPDGQGAAASFNGAQGLAVDSSGNIYVADTGNDTIRMVSTSGYVSTFAGKTGLFGVVDGTGSEARFNGPVGVVIDSSGNLYVADSAIRKVTSSGVVTTLAGAPGVVGSADGTGSAAQFYALNRMAIDSSGNLYVTVANNTIRKITSSGVVTTLAGTPGATGSADGTGAKALFNQPFGIAVDSSGDLFVSDSLNFTIRASYAATYAPPAITAQPASESVSIGGTATFSASASGVPIPGYQWQFNGSNIPGATNPTLTLTNVQATNLGTYSLVVTNSVGNAVSNPATLSSPGITPVAPTPAAPRLINISSRVFVGTGESVAIAGFVVSGPAGATEQVLVRGIGPSLTGFGLSGVLAEPMLSIFDSSGALITTSPAYWDFTDIVPAEYATGAFPINYGTMDTAILANLTPGSYTAEVSGTAGSTGVALAEVYEVASVNAQLDNISCRCYVGTGSSIAIAGFVVSGSESQQVLIRGVGPALSSFGVIGVLAQPVLTVFNSAGTQVAANTGWGTNSNAAQISTAFTSTGAFVLPSGSADSALLLTLAPGSYTAQVSGLNSTTGNALIEVYKVPGGN